MAPKSKRKKQNQLICDNDRGGRGGSQKSRKVCGHHIWKPPCEFWFHNFGVGCSRVMTLPPPNFNPHPLPGITLRQLSPSVFLPAGGFPTTALMGPDFPFHLGSRTGFLIVLVLVVGVQRTLGNFPSFRTNSESLACGDNIYPPPQHVHRKRTCQIR